MSDQGTPPVIPSDLLPYESYTEDPKWQIRFTAMWCAALGLIILLAAPRALSLRSVRESLRGLLGLRVRGDYEPLPEGDEKNSSSGTTPTTPLPIQRRNVLTTVSRVLGSVRLWSLPGITLNMGQSSSQSFFTPRISAELRLLQYSSSQATLSLRWCAS